MKRVALAIIAAIAGISLYLLTSASANSDLFADRYPYLLALNGVVAVGLAGLVGVQLRSLWREYRARKFGSRLKYRMMMMFALMALLPGLVVYAVSLQFVVRSIESWFDVRVDSALEGGIALGQNALDYLVSQVNAKAGDMALDLEGFETVSPATLSRLRETAGVSNATVLAPNGQVVATASDGGVALLPDLPSSAQLRQARQSRSVSTVDSHPDGRLVIRVVVPIPTRSILSEPQLLQLTQPVPDTFSRHAEAVQEAYRDYQQLTLGRDGLKRIYSLTLTLTLLLALLTAMAVAFVLARRLAAPLLILAEGTQAVAQGDYRPRQALPARDELGVLTQSFNQMVRQLEDARAAADRNRAAVEAARAYLESVLANLSTGVLAFAGNGTLRAANRGAMDILADDLAGFEDIALADWVRHGVFRDALLEGFATHESDWHEQIEIPSPDSTPLTLLVHGSRLPESTGGGLVVVFDDITRLVDAQRTAAWAEVARRLAHEIKNPLTPIQLSAERLALKLADQLDEDGKAMLERATRTIVNQVEAMKNLVNAFRDYARLPAPELVALDLAALMREVLHLYESAAVRIRLQVGDDLPKVLGDASQIRQIIHNMLQNAQDAVLGKDDAEITLLARADGDRVLLVCRDNGPGFPAEILARAFEPYFTTKSKGTGLGLAMVKKIVAEHGGEIRIANRDIGGAEVRIRLRTILTNGEH
ncbi:PAS domain-containing sensor histidine kinase [Parazoarcus communis]|uniref:histidine kinase n=1 Tax=Parazoarcus communis TaxID=41977 RepID=A0A2U8GWE8_9RHOO|nr:ATP-binding protein [Parazoarcus communis]AWI77720.1 PAS domain-containing sensor histidine kinase [Parazoarcus communis]TVT54009.1 MAG: HAMP domain-containing protein [Azoarcus sp. PHD]